MSYIALDYCLQDHVATITLAQEDVLNALTPELVSDLTDVLAEIRDDNQARAIVLTGRGRAFSVGGSVKSFGEGFSPADGYRFMSNGVRWLKELVLMPKPVIAAVNGFAMGAGLSMALATDIILAADNAKFGTAFSKIALVPDSGMLYFLPRLVGLQRAKELIYSGRTFDAAEALSLGIALQVVPADQLMEEARKLAFSLAAGPTLALGQARNILNRSHALTLEEVLERENAAQAILFQTSDFREGIQGFRERRSTNFTGS